jgi:hypothetical protein
MAGTADAQATVEYGLGAARGSMSAAPAKGVGNAIGGLAGSLEKLFKSGPSDSEAEAEPARPAPAHKTVTKSAPAAAQAKTPAPAPAAVDAALPPKPAWEDPAGIRTGMSYPELVRRFGPPALAITGDEGRLLTYAGKSGSLQLEVRDDMVTSIQRPKS